jgi:hypothetical protein
MEESRPGTCRTRSASMVVVGLAAAAACLIALMWAQAPPAQGKPPPPTTGAPDEPSFVVNCDFSHRNHDDPIVHPYPPGAQGAAHQHDFFGNTSTDWDSTYNSMLGLPEPTTLTTPEASPASASASASETTSEDTTSTPEETTPPGPKSKDTAPETTSASEETISAPETTSTPPGTTCRRAGDTSAYWIPTVSWNEEPLTELTPEEELTASKGVFYYRTNDKADDSILPYRADLRIITPRLNREGLRVTWRCVGGSIPGEGEYSQTPPTQCSTGQLGVRVIFPDCVAPVEGASTPYTEEEMARYWDEAQGAPDETTVETTGKHRTHMVFASNPPGSTTATCPSTHPIPVPSLRVILTFPIPTTSGEVALSTEDPSYTRMHSDFWNTWQQEDLRFLVTECINNYPHRKGRPTVCTASGQADAQ